MSAARWAVGVGAVAMLAYLAAWPTPLEPAAWSADPVAPRFSEPLHVLSGVQIVSTPGRHGPEDVALGADGALYAGTHDGAILRWATLDADPTVFAETGGRPLGLDVAPDGRLIVADANAGLLAVDVEGRVETLATSCGGTPLVFADDLEITDDGVVWFSDASQRFGQPVWKLDILESGSTGRLCSHDLATGKTEEVVTGLHFANGVALGPDDAFVLVNETSRYRVRRYWLKGPRAGQLEIWLEGLPGFPDGISSADDGRRFWLALASTRNGTVDAAAGMPWLRQVLYRLPDALKPRAARHPWVIELDEEGRVIRNLDDPDGATFGMTTSAQQHGDLLYIGSLKEPAFAVLGLK